MSEAIPTLVTLLALGVYFWTGILVARARAKYKIDAPAMTGNPDFERVVRVQMNTLEYMPIFIPLLWMFSLTVDPVIGGILGVCWAVGRIMYAQGYIAAANKRGTGFMIQGLACIAMFLGVLVGVIWKLAGMAPMLSQPLL